MVCIFIDFGSSRVKIFKDGEIFHHFTNIPVIRHNLLYGFDVNNPDSQNAIKFFNCCAGMSRGQIENLCIYKVSKDIDDIILNDKYYIKDTIFGLLDYILYNLSQYINDEVVKCITISVSNPDYYNNYYISKYNYKYNFVKNTSPTFINTWLPIYNLIRKELNISLSQIEQITINDIYTYYGNKSIARINKSTLYSKLGIQNPFNKDNMYRECELMYRNHNKCNIEINSYTDDTSKPTLMTSIGINTDGGIYVPIISRGNELPIEKSLKFLNSDDKQNSIHLEIFAGENKFIRDNIKIGELHIDIQDIRYRCSTIIYVEMSIDSNGLLTVTLTLPITKNKKIINIDIHDYIGKPLKLNIEDEIKKINDTYNTRIVLECQELIYIINKYKSNKNLQDDKQEYIKYAEYLVENHHMFNSDDIKLFIKEFEMKMV